MRYITIPGPVQCIDASNDQPLPDVIPFAKAVSLVCVALVNKQALDTLDVIALRTAVTQAKVGEEIAIDSAWWEALKSEFKRTNALGPAYLLSAGPHIRAVLDAKEAPSEKAVLMAETNGASAAAAS